MEKLNQMKINRLITLFMIFILNNSLIYGEIKEAEWSMERYKDSRLAIVNENEINIWQFPDTDSKVLAKANQLDVILVTGRYQDWYRIHYKYQTGWMFSKYVEGFNLHLLPEITPVSSEDLFRRQIVDYAKKFIGTPYKYGGTSLETGVDCSGFTQAVMKEFDISLKRSSKEQAMNGIPVKREELSPADLVFFDTSGTNNGKVSHVGLYIGNNRFIHATSSKGVKIDNLSQPYYNRAFVKAISVIGQK